ncbi:biliverdin-producing heme oxygenase [Roseibium sp.]
MTSGQTSEGLPLSKRLKATTQSTHERLDTKIMAARPCADLANYARFLQVQFILHRDVYVLYELPDVSRRLQGLDAFSRFRDVKQDLVDLDVEVPSDLPANNKQWTMSFAEALGWLYVIEGSKLGAAVLSKAAVKLGLCDTFGARHLAPAPEGPARHWRRFTDKLDAADLDAAQFREASTGAQAAFARASDLADSILPKSKSCQGV